MAEMDPNEVIHRLLARGLEWRASDLHLEPVEDGYQVRARIDGELLLMKESRDPKNLFLSVISRLKLLAGLDIGQKRLPQDGSFSYQVLDQHLDVRLATLPIYWGEKVALRLLSGYHFQSYRELGMSEMLERRFQTLMKRPGLVLVTGSTGSGKTTTLYTALHQMDRVKQNILTLEDPIEYHIKGVHQVQVNTLAGLTFTSGLRAILRQDPNVILLGEIRDRETAQMALRAGMTGRLVLSTLHTHEPSQAGIRLLDMGAEPYLVASGLNGVLSQRLVSKVCSACHGIGEKCHLCQGKGTYGRVARFELLLMDSHLRELIMQRTSSEAIRKYAVEKRLLLSSKPAQRASDSA